MVLSMTAALRKFPESRDSQLGSDVRIAVLGLLQTIIGNILADIRGG
jgi:hypothetical protein